MPHFSAKGNDTYLCQKCARIYDSVDHPSKWEDKVGNVCPKCQKKQSLTAECVAVGTDWMTKPPLSLHEHCSRESGHPLGSVALTNYINRYYGHG